MGRGLASLRGHRAWGGHSVTSVGDSLGSRWHVLPVTHCVCTFLSPPPHPTPRADCSPLTTLAVALVTPLSFWELWNCGKKNLTVGVLELGAGPSLCLTHQDPGHISSSLSLSLPTSNMARLIAFSRRTVFFNVSHYLMFPMYSLARARNTQRKPGALARAKGDASSCHLPACFSSLETYEFHKIHPSKLLHTGRSLVC